MCPGVRRARAGAPVAARVADRLHGRPRGRARGLVRAPRRHDLGDHRARRRRRAARVPERVPAPRQLLCEAPAPGSPSCGARSTGGRGTSRVACARCRRARRSARCATRTSRCAGARRRVGPARVREPRPRRRQPLARVPRGRARRRRVGASSTSSAAWSRPARRCRATGRSSPTGSRRRTTCRASTPRCSASIDDVSTPAAHLGTHAVLVPGLRRAQPTARPATSSDQEGVGVVRAHAGRPHGTRVRRADARCPRSPTAQTMRDVDRRAASREHQRRSASTSRRFDTEQMLRPVAVQPVPERRPCWCGATMLNVLIARPGRDARRRRAGRVPAAPRPSRRRAAPHPRRSPRARRRRPRLGVQPGHRRAARPRSAASHQPGLTHPSRCRARSAASSTCTATSSGTSASMPEPDGYPPSGNRINVQPGPVATTSPPANFSRHTSEAHSTASTPYSLGDHAAVGPEEPGRGGTHWRHAGRPDLDERRRSSRHNNTES